MKTFATMLLVVALLAPISWAASVFDKPELRTATSPGEARRITLPAGARVVDSDVSPAGPTAALLVLQAAGTREILFWDVRQPQTTKGWDVPAGFAARSLAWHPEGKALFLAGPQEVHDSQTVFAARRAVRRMTRVADYLAVLVAPVHPRERVIHLLERRLHAPEAASGEKGRLYLRRVDGFRCRRPGADKGGGENGKTAVRRRSVLCIDTPMTRSASK